MDESSSREFEWPDGYHLQHLDELKMFFDRYLKGIRNCWESTPRVRLEVEDALEFNYDAHHEKKNNSQLRELNIENYI